MKPRTVVVLCVLLAFACATDSGSSNDEPDDRERDRQVVLTLPAPDEPPEGPAFDPSELDALNELPADGEPPGRYELPPPLPPPPTQSECAARHPDVKCASWDVETYSSCSGARAGRGYVQRVQWQCLCHECRSASDCPVPGSICSRVELMCNPPSSTRCLAPDHPCRSADCPPSRCSVHERLGKVQCISDAPPP